MKSQQIVALILGIIFITFAICVRAEVPELPAGELVDRARIAAGEDEHRAAIALYSRAIAEDSTRADIVAYELARQYTWAEVTDSAIYWFDAFLEVHPGNVDGRLGRALALSWAGRHAEAEVAYRSVLADGGGGRTEALLGLAEVNAWQGRYATAERYYRQALDSEPDNVEARVGLAQVTNLSGRNHRARDMFDTVLADDRANWDATAGLAWALHWSGRTGAAIRLLDEHAGKPEAAFVRTAIANDRTGRGSLTYTRRDNTTDGERDVLRAVAAGWMRSDTQFGIEAATGRMTNDAYPRIDQNEVVGVLSHQLNATFGVVLRPGFQWNRFAPIVPPGKTEPAAEFDLFVWDVYLSARRDWLRVDIGSARETIDTPLAVFNRVHVTTENVGLDWRWTPGIMTQWEARYADYSDDNRRIDGREEIHWTPEWRPFTGRENFVVLSQGFQYMNFADVLGSGYFNPDEYIVLYGGLRLVSDISDRVRIDVFGRLGSEREAGLDWQAVTAFGAAMRVRSRSGFEIEAGYEHSDASISSPGGFESHVFYVRAQMGLGR